MSAREKLFEAMAGGWSLTQTESAGLYRIIDDALAVHAHELAERQRASGVDEYCWGTDCCNQHGGVADLIDPPTSEEART